MYIKKLTIWFFILLSVVLAACSDTTDIRGGDTPDVPPDGVVLTLKLPNFTKNTVATRATTEPTEQTISSLCVLCYDADDNYLGMSTPSSIKDKGNDTYDVKVKAVPGTATLHLVANTDVSESDDAKDDSGKNHLYNATRSNTPNLKAPVCWGSVSVENLLSGSTSTKVSLFRQFAKASVTKDDKLTNFEITGFKLINTATKGTIATKSLTDVALPSVKCSYNTAYSESERQGELPGELPFYETPADNAFMIIRAKYDHGAETYYKVAFLSKNADGTSEPMALLRNHHYKVKVTAVNHAGYDTEVEAINNLPENGISVDVVDDNPKIVNMIACKDYELGVCAGQEVEGKAHTATITFVTTKKDNGYNDFSVVSNDTWITFPTDYKSSITSIDLPTSATSTGGKLYTMSLNLEQNYNSDAHTGSVTIKYGDLSLNVDITQLGYDFRHDDNRKVQIRGLDGLSSDEEKDYFGWMDSKLNGIEPKYNQGKVRNDGLHFFVGNKTVDNKTVSYNTVYYLIPRLPNDEMKYDDKRVKVDDDFIEDGKNFYKVSLADNSPESNYNMWICSDALTISITNSVTKITVKYPVYHVGLFAQLTGKAAADYQLGKDKASGERKDSEWYYYEMVDVKAGDKTYHMLDRNLGATNNDYYSPSTTALKDNKGAIGGYFKISVATSKDEAKNDVVVDALAIGNFKVCDNACLKSLVNKNVLAIETKTTATGEVYNCLGMNTVGNSQIPQIFIPMSGYYEGKNNDDGLKDIHHANLWTSSRLSDYQGFSSSSPEYGFWYIYLDVFGMNLNLSNYRFVSGSSGKNTGRYRAMPVRLVAE